LPTKTVTVSRENAPRHQGVRSGSHQRGISMRPSRSSLPRVALALAALVVVTSCSSPDDSSSPPTSGATGASGTSSTTGPVTTGPVAAFDGQAPDEIAPPESEGDGVVVPQPAAPLPDGYVQEELLVGGTATRFDADDTPDDGFWAATPGEEAEYRTRVIVRRP